MSDLKRARTATAADAVASEPPAGGSLAGFVDLQVNGYKGIDFSSPSLTPETAASACRDYLREAGCAAFCPTVVTSSLADYSVTLRVLADVMLLPEFKGRLPGIHIEGPFISPEPGAVGAHPVEHTRAPDVALFDKLCELARGRIRIITIAAELEGAAALVAHAVSHGVAVSLGHQICTGEQLEQCRAAGATLLTHLGNGIPNSVHRHTNGIMAGIANDGLVAMLITDSFHLPHDILKTIVRAKGVERVLVTSDIAKFGGMEPGDYEWLGEPCRLEPSGFLHMPARKCMAGSSCHMIKCMNHLHSLGLFELEDLIRVGMINPLRALGLTAEDVCSTPMLQYSPESGFSLLAASEHAK